MNTNIDWTHKEVSIKDIRKLSKLYVIKIVNKVSVDQIEAPLFVKDIIFEERLKSYFLRDLSKIDREDILGVRWNMYITKGYYIKMNDMGGVDQHAHDPNKWYVSYLEIDGPLGTFSSVFRDKELKEKESYNTRP